MPLFLSVCGGFVIHFVAIVLCPPCFSLLENFLSKIQNLGLVNLWGKVEIVAHVSSVLYCTVFQIIFQHVHYDNST